VRVVFRGLWRLCAVLLTSLIDLNLPLPRNCTRAGSSIDGHSEQMRLDEGSIAKVAVDPPFFAALYAGTQFPGR
jgi:hypothetical protein